MSYKSQNNNMYQKSSTLNSKSINRRRNEGDGDKSLNHKDVSTNDKNDHIYKFSSSSDSSDNEIESLNGAKSHTLERTEKILINVLKSYGTQDALNTKSENKSIQIIKESLNKSNDNTCLICISTVKHKHAIWSCPTCFTIFHLQCIQTWINDGAYKNAINPVITASFDIEIKWTCPKCRAEYDKACAPIKYLCFCGKEVNPSHEDPWLLPHSCGKICSKTLTSCSHTCLMLCHPGPCPPCPKTLRTSCHCGSAQPVVRRCAAKTWSCGKVCKKKLDCGQHSCHLNCHSGSCPPCKKESIQPCDCGHNMGKRSCQSPSWKCNKVCGKEFSCGHHECELVCHEPPCQQYCPRSGIRTCPCGKQTYEDIPCYKETPSCGQTCEKMMPCGLHRCQERCHVGPCGTCRQPMEKVCRCGQSKRTVQCNKDLLCEIRCPKLRNCGVHFCRRKCCDGKCVDCDLVCGAQLNCRKHKCTSPCHRGLCYPCSMTIKIPCVCGKTIKTVPCGKEKRSKPPNCKEFCRKPPGCHHAKTEQHYCHFGDCPPCRMSCGRILPCSHPCREMCHTFVLVPKASLSQITVAGERATFKQSDKRNAPWEPKPSNELTHTRLDCPPCRQPVSVQCLGGHGSKEFECHAVQPYSCGDVCGRRLQCANHTCTLTCHSIPAKKGHITPDHLSSQKGVATFQCEICAEPCTKPRPTGCPHECELPCHPGPCPPCNKMIKMRCLCTLNSVYVECGRWRDCLDNGGTADASVSKKETLLSCGNRCPNLLPRCGHRCPNTCHEPPCIRDGKKCQAKVKVQCKCRTVKKVLPCHQITSRTRTEEDGSDTLIACQECCFSKNHSEASINRDVDGKTETDPAVQMPFYDDDQKRTKPKKVRFDPAIPETLEKCGKSWVQYWIFLPLFVVLFSIAMASYFNLFA